MTHYSETAFSDERADWLARCVLPHESALRSWLRRKSPLGFDVDDIVQETYAILAAKSDIAAIRNPKTYAFQVAYSVVLQQIRRSSVVPIRAVVDIGAIEAMLDEPSPEQTVQARQELGRVQGAINAMPKQTRQAFILRRVEGLAQAEIARRMKLSEHTVEKHIARGIKLLLAEFGRGGSGALGASKEEKAKQEKAKQEKAKQEKGSVRRDRAQTNRSGH